MFYTSKPIFKGFSFLLCAALFVATFFPTCAFAASVEKPDIIYLNEQPDKVFENLSENSNSYQASIDGIKTKIPKNSEDPVESILEDGDKISLSFPQEIDAGKGELEDGVVQYDSDDDVKLYSQVETETVGKESFISNRIMTQIENPQAPKEYTYTFNMPTGYRLVSDVTYNGEMRKDLLSKKGDILESGVSAADFEKLLEKYEESFGEVYVVDDKNIVRQIIEKPWAKDANGNDVFTKYTISENSLVQHVSFDENTAFPVLADPKVGTTKSFSVKISNESMGLPSLSISTLTTFAKKKIKTKVKNKIISVVGSKFVPGLNIASTVAAIFAYINYLTGKKGVKVYGSMKYVRHYIHKGGYYIYAWDIKSINISRY